MLLLHSCCCCGFIHPRFSPLFVLPSSVGKLEEGEILTPSHYPFFFETSHATGDAGAHARCFVPSEKILRNCRRCSCLLVWRSPENPFNSFGPHQFPPHHSSLPLFQSNSGRSEKGATAADSRTKWNTMMERKIGSCDKGIFLKGRRRRRRSVYPRKRGEGRRGCRVPSHSDKRKRVIFFPGAP